MKLKGSAPRTPVPLLIDAFPAPLGELRGGFSGVPPRHDPTPTPNATPALSERGLGISAGLALFADSSKKLN